MSETMTTPEETSPPKLPLWVDHRRRELRWETDNGPVVLSYPMVLTSDELGELEEVMALALRSIRRTTDRLASRPAHASEG